jgi:hypothetical protein
MTTKVKILLGVVDGAAAGICIGILMSNTEMIENMKESLSDAGDKIRVHLKKLMDENQGLLGELHEKLTDLPRSLSN